VAALMQNFGMEFLCLIILELSSHMSWTTLSASRVSFSSRRMAKRCPVRQANCSDARGTQMLVHALPTCGPVLSNQTSQDKCGRALHTGH
jgi:hypothetical protein